MTESTRSHGKVLPQAGNVGPGLCPRNDGRIIQSTFRAAAHGEALAASLTVCATCPSQRRSNMAIAPTFQRYLATKNVVYDIVVHEPTKSAMRTAEACRVSGDRVAKAVVLHDEYGYVLAILPASHQIRLDDLRRQLGLDVDLAAEYEIEELFDDCIPGAIPPVGECYGLETAVDDGVETGGYLHRREGQAHHDRVRRKNGSRSSSGSRQPGPRPVAGVRAARSREASAPTRRGWPRR